MHSFCAGAEKGEGYTSKLLALSTVDSVLSGNTVINKTFSPSFLFFVV